MPLQNRVDPFGAIFRSPARGTFMGNRGGALHNEQREIVRPYLNRRWIACVLEFRGRRRVIMAPRRYTELFFLDEAVTFAAGHRPCAECRYTRFKAFQAAWLGRANANVGTSARADDIDAELHRARLDPQKRKRTYRAPLRSLPDGCFVEIDRAPWLVLGDALCLWTPARYAEKQRRSGRLTVTVLTPQPIVECFRQGYRPEMHSSASAL